MKEARFAKDLETKEKRLANIVERVKTLGEEKAAALKKLRTVEAERDQLIQINAGLQAEKESLMVDVSV